VVVIPSSPYYSAFGFGYAAAVDKQDILKAANDALIKTAKEFNIPEDRATTHAVMGSPKEQILKLADIINADLIVIGSHRPSTRTYLLGSNAAAVVRHAKCSVLVVR
jgi:universal stress protein F